MWFVELLSSVIREAGMHNLKMASLKPLKNTLCGFASSADERYPPVPIPLNTNPLLETRVSELHSTALLESRRLYHNFFLGGCPLERKKCLLSGMGGWVRGERYPN